tara:strand:- start:69 stop:581 length:513 start_codon:yes stop_codon:yes gene_type:complete
MANLTGQNIQDTYQRLLQTDNGTLRDGTGSLVDELTIPGTGSFGRILCTTISASTGQFDDATIFLGDTSFNKAELDTLKEGKSIRTTSKDLKEGDGNSNDIIVTKGIFSVSDDDTLIKFGNNIMGCIVSGSPFFTIQKNDSTNRVTIGNGTTDLRFSGSINEATLDGGTF